MAKKFKEVNDWDFIYMLNPFTLKIEALKVKSIHGLHDDAYRGAAPSLKQKKGWVHIVYYRSELILQVTDLDKAHTVDLIVDGELPMQLVAIPVENQIGLIPVPYSPDKEYLQLWMDKTG